MILRSELLSRYTKKRNTYPEAKRVIFIFCVQFVDQELMKIAKKIRNFNDRGDPATITARVRQWRRP